MNGIVDAIERLRRAFDAAGLAPPVAILVEAGQLRSFEEAASDGMFMVRLDQPGDTQVSGVRILEAQRQR